MLGGSEFRLRQGFACGKTLVTRHSARPPEGGIYTVVMLQKDTRKRVFLFRFRSRWPLRPPVIEMPVGIEPRPVHIRKKPCSERKITAALTFFMQDGSLLQGGFQTSDQGA